MGLFSKLFGSKKDANNGIPALTKTAELLDEDLYWKIISESLRHSENQDDQEHSLIAQIQHLSPTEMIGFRLRTDMLLHETYTSEMWCAAYIINGGCSDDGFEYFRNWVISRGKDVFYKAKDNPDSLVSQVGDETGLYDFESFWYVALEAFSKSTGKELYDYVDNDKMPYGEGKYPEIEFNWKEEDPETMKAICPALFEKMWDKTE